MYKKILVPLDGSNFSEQVLPYARVIAEAYRAPVELLRITDPDARPPFLPASAGRSVPGRNRGEIISLLFCTGRHSSRGRQAGGSDHRSCQR